MKRNWESKPYDLGSSGYVEGSFKWKASAKGELLPKGSTAAASEGCTTNQGVKGKWSWRRTRSRTC